MCTLSWPADYEPDGLSGSRKGTSNMVLSAPLSGAKVSHILCKYALLRSFTEAFSLVRSPQILISQVTVAGFKPVCAADITIQAFQINSGSLS